MKRTPLKRRKPLRREAPVARCANPGCDNTFVVEPGRKERYCCRACFHEGYRLTAEGRRAKQQAMASRQGSANPNYRHGRRAGVRNREGGARWRVALRRRCELHAADCAMLIQHHVIYRQTVRREGGDEWDPRNSLTLCTASHTSHHRRGTIIPLTVIPSAAFFFAAELLGRARAYEYLRRRYAGEDPRLDALLHPA